MNKLFKIAIFLVVAVIFLASIAAWIPELIENWDKGSVALRTMPILAIGLSVIGFLTSIFFAFGGRVR